MYIALLRIKNTHALLTHTFKEEKELWLLADGGVHPSRKYDCKYSQPFIEGGVDDDDSLSFEYRIWQIYNSPNGSGDIRY